MRRTPEQVRKHFPETLRTDVLTVGDFKPQHSRKMTTLPSLRNILKHVFVNGHLTFSLFRASLTIWTTIAQKNYIIYNVHFGHLVHLVSLENIDLQGQGNGRPLPPLLLLKKELHIKSYTK